MNKERAVSLLHAQLEFIEGLRSKQGTPEFKKWYRDTEVTIENVFGVSGRHVSDFKKVRFSPGFYPCDKSYIRKVYQDGLSGIASVLESQIDEIDKFWEDVPEACPVPPSALTRVQLLCERFHPVARQLRKRHGGRETIDIGDEYDVQDLFHALLRLYFDDIRPEEFTPSCAGRNSRVDFLLKREDIVIEIKMTRKGLADKQVSEQLLIDIARYADHPNCDHLVCFVYDPDGRISNAAGLINDIESKHDWVKVIVKPE